MGDDNEIRDLIHREAEEFIAKAKAATQDVKAYDFETEFAKTSKNRSRLVPLITMATIVVLGGVALGVTAWIQQRNAAAPVDVRSFEDLNLKDLLDTAKRNEADMKKVQADLGQLQFDLKAGLDAADREYNASLETIKARSTGKADEDRQSAAAKAAWQKKRAALEAAASPALAAKQAEVKDIQARIDKYDQRLMKQAQEQQALLDNAQKLAEIERQKLSTEYEGRLSALQSQRRKDIAALVKQREDLAASLTARYNPVFADPRDLSLLSSWKAPAKFGPWQALPDYLVSSGLLARDQVTRLDESLSDLQYLSGRLSKVPWINSVPPALSRLQAEALNSIGGYRAALDSASTGVADRDRQIADRERQIADRERQIADILRREKGVVAERDAAKVERDRLAWAISSYALARRESGFVVDPRDPQSIILAMNPSIPVLDGSKAYILRGDKAVATVGLSIRDGIATAAVIEPVDGESVQPFDSVLVRTDAESTK